MTILTVIASFLCWSCGSDSDLIGNSTNAGNGIVDGISADIISMDFSGGGATRTEGVQDKYQENYFDMDGLTPYSMAFTKESILHVSQHTTPRPAFLSDEDIYTFRYMPEQTDASWDDENTFNFAPYRQTTPLEWNTIGNGGSVNGGFAMYSLYFPGEEKVRRKTLPDGSIGYSVMQDQSTLENLHKSDILGAYHSTDKMFERIKFKLYHLMTYVRIRLYVPLYDNEKNTGFREDALLYATLNHVTPDFSIDWGAIRSSDSQGPFVTALSGDDEIIMYQHPLEEGQTSHPITEIHYNDYFRDGYYDQGITGDTDKVRVYDFSVIIPKQKGLSDDGQESTFTKTDFLNFYFRTNSGAVTRYYFNES